VTFIFSCRAVVIESWPFYPEITEDAQKRAEGCSQIGNCWLSNEWSFTENRLSIIKWIKYIYVEVQQKASSCFSLEMSRAGPCLTGRLLSRVTNTKVTCLSRFFQCNSIQPVSKSVLFRGIISWIPANILITNTRTYVPRNHVVMRPRLQIFT